MQLLKLPHMLDRATTTHLLLGMAMFGRDSQDDGDDGCIYTFVHMSGLETHNFQAGVCSNTWDEMLQMQLYRWNLGTIYLGSSTPVSVALFMCRVLIFPLLRLLCFYSVALLIGSFYSFQVCQPWLMSFAAALLRGGDSSWVKGAFSFSFPITEIWYWKVGAFSGKLWLLPPCQQTRNPGRGDLGVLVWCLQFGCACCALVFLDRLMHPLVKYCPHVISWESLAEGEVCFMGLLGLMMDGRGLWKCATFFLEQWQ